MNNLKGDDQRWWCGDAEREISGLVFAGFVSQIERLENPVEDKSAIPYGPRIVWSRLCPATLRVTLPETSWLAAATSRVWNRARYVLFGQISHDVVVSNPDLTGHPQLFYRIALDAMAWPRHIRQPEKVAWGAEYIRNYCRRLGMELVIVLIPDREFVYREYVPVVDGQDPREWPPSTLFDIEAELLKGVRH